VRAGGLSKQLRFDDRVVLVTGAGRGLGRAYALYIAGLGASVLVNDIGVSVDGFGTDVGPAAAVVAEIASAGGRAAPNTGTVSTTEGAEAMVAAALDCFGRLDAVINNAGILTVDEFPAVRLERLMEHFSVHVAGTFNVSRAAWSALAAHGSGRILNTTSTAMFGRGSKLAYGVSKGALVSMTRALADAGREHGIRVNALAPAAETRMATDPRFQTGQSGAVKRPGEEPDPARAPELVAPMAALLSHDACPVSGEVISSGFGRYARIFWAETEGYFEPGLHPGELLDRWPRIVEPRQYTVPATSADSVARLESQLAENPGNSPPSLGAHHGH
jgi:NAD(P)-dependent dehydrogenase (short-subunit alcohol dehydrogenase family)